MTDEDIAAAACGSLGGLDWCRIPDMAREEMAEFVFMLRHGHTPAEAHEDFCDRLRDRGWLHGPQFSLADKTDPRLLRYDALPPGFRCGFENFAKAVRELL